MRHEISFVRKGRDHQAGRTVTPATELTLDKLGIARAAFDRGMFNESTEKLTPAEVYFGTAEPILAEPESINLPPSQTSGSIAASRPNFAPDEVEFLFPKYLTGLILPDYGQRGWRFRGNADIIDRLADEAAYLVASYPSRWKASMK